MIKISKYIDEKLVCLLSSKNRDEVLLSMIDTLYAKEVIDDKELFYQSLQEREKVVSTAIGLGVAIPHAKIREYNRFFIAIGLLSKGVEWNSLDGAPVRIVFMIGGPDDKQTEYLQILSSLTTAIKDEARRKKLLTLQSPEAIIDLFKGL